MTLSAAAAAPAAPATGENNHFFEDMMIMDDSDANILFSTSRGSGSNRSENDTVSENSHHEAAQVLHVWQQEDGPQLNDADDVEDDDDDDDDTPMMMIGVIPDFDENEIVSSNDIQNEECECECDDDIIMMQLEDDEGLLPALNDFSYDAILPISTPSTAPLVEPPTDIAVAILSESDEDSFFSANQGGSDDLSIHTDTDSSYYSSHSSHSSSSPSPSSSSSYSNHPTTTTTSSSTTNSFAFQDLLGKLSDSMRRSQQTRHSLYFAHHRSKSTDHVLRRIEYSSRQVDSHVIQSLLLR